MRGIKLDLTQTPAALVLGDSVTGNTALVQNTAVNVVTAKGSDSVSPDRGTTLRRRLLDGRVLDIVTAQHEANFESVKLKNSIQRDIVPQPGSALSAIRIDVLRIERLSYFTNIKLTVSDTNTPLEIQSNV